MRLLYLTRSLGVHDIRFLTAFVQHQVEVGLVTLVPTKTAAPDLPDGVALLGNLGGSAQRDWEDVSDMVSRLQSLALVFGPELVLAGPLSDCTYLAVVAKLNCPIVAQSWAFDVLWEALSDSPARLRVQTSLKSSSGLFVDCEAVALRCREICGVPFRSLFVMPWGIESPESNIRPSESRKSEKLSREFETRILYTRGMEPVHSIGILLEAFSSLSRKERNLVLILAGDGSQREAVTKFVEVNRLDASVRILGAVPHDRLLELYAETDCFVSCAASDGTSISLLEAMYFGLPAVVPEVGGNSEWVVSGKNGWIFPPRDVNALEEALGKAIRMPIIEREAMKAENRSLLNKKANWSANFPRFLNYLSTVVDHKIDVSRIAKDPDKTLESRNISGQSDSLKSAR